MLRLKIYLPTRETATQTLSKMPKSAVEALKKYFEASSDVEAKSRLKKILDRLQEDAEGEITDELRKGAVERIQAYQSKLSLLHTVKISEDHATGVIMVRNSGEKKIKRLELTLVVSISGKDKPEEHRILFIEKNGFVAPPKPSTDGAALSKVDVHCFGDVKGSPELKLTYIQFEGD